MVSLKMYCSLLGILVFSFVCQTHGGRIKPNIVREMKDFEHLIPKAVIDEIAAKHMLTDSEFRKAFKFMKSSQLPQLIQRIQQIPEIIEIFEFLHIWENTQSEVLEVTTTNAWILQPPQMQHNNYTIDFVLINAGGETLATAPVTTAPQNMHSVEKVRDFVLEVLGHLNRDHFSSMIAEKKTQNADFNTMYKALRSAEFRPKVDAALKSQNVANVIELLLEHGINVSVLEPIAFEMLSWGPPAVRRRRKYKVLAFPRSSWK